MLCITQVQEIQAELPHSEAEATKEKNQSIQNVHIFSNQIQNAGQSGG